MANSKFVPIDVFVSVVTEQLEMIAALDVTVRALRMALLEEKILSPHVLNRKQAEYEKDAERRAQVAASRARIEDLLRNFEGPIQ